MKIYITILLLSICLTQTFAQDSTEHHKTRELYLTLANVNPINIGIKYKHQLGKSSFLKLGLIDLLYRHDYISSAGTPSNTSYENDLYSGGILLGIEFRKKIDKRFTFYHGPNLGFTTVTSVNKRKDHFSPYLESKITNTNFIASVPYTLGFLVNLSGHFFFSAEINPSVSYSTNSNGRAYSFTAGFTNNYGLLSLVYRL